MWIFSLELGRGSLLFRDPVVWNCLDKNARECENIDTFKRVLKTSTNKAALEKVSFKGTCMNYSKDLDDFVLFLIVFILFYFINCQFVISNVYPLMLVYSCIYL